MKCIVYILYSKSLDKFYVGSTCDSMDNRLAKHNAKHVGFTAKANDWVVVYEEDQPDKSAALKREKQIKAWKSRAMILKLINSMKRD